MKGWKPTWVSHSTPCWARSPAQGPVPTLHFLVSTCPSPSYLSGFIFSWVAKNHFPGKPASVFPAPLVPKPACCSDITALSWELLLGGWLGSLQKPCCSKEPISVPGVPARGDLGTWNSLAGLFEGWKQLNDFIGLHQALVILAWETQVLYVSLCLPSLFCDSSGH